MKKVIGILLLTMGLCACSSKEVAVSSSEPVKKEPVKSDLWTIRPETKLDNVEELESGINQIAYVHTSTFGNIVVKFEGEIIGSPAEQMGYTKDAVIVEQNNKQGVWNYKGKELYPIELSKMNSAQMEGIKAGAVLEGDVLHSIYGISDLSSSKTKVFSEDFTEEKEISSDQFINPEIDNNTAPYFALQDNIFGVVGMTVGEAGNHTGWAFEALDSSVVSSRLLVSTIDANCHKTGTVIYDPSSNTSVPLASVDGTYVSGSFVNGYYCMSDGTYTNLIHASSGQSIASGVQDVRPDIEGYIPVKKYGKWGLINEQGEELTDFIFDDVTTVANGLMYASIDGAWGSLKVTDTLKAGKQINYATVHDALEEKEIGEIIVNVSDLTIRGQAGTGGVFLGNACDGSVYPVYEKTEAEGHTWYRIGKEAWVADNGSWLTFTEKGN